MVQAVEPQGTRKQKRRQSNADELPQDFSGSRSNEGSSNYRSANDIRNDYKVESIIGK